MWKKRETQSQFFIKIQTLKEIRSVTDYGKKAMWREDASSYHHNSLTRSKYRYISSPDGKGIGSSLISSTTDDTAIISENIK